MQEARTQAQPAPPTYSLERAGTTDRETFLEREWLDTNGLGDYASSTALFAATRRYHGLFVARPPGSARRYLFLSRLEEVFRVESGKEGSGEHLLSTARYEDRWSPDGAQNLERFTLGHGPCAAYSVGEGRLERAVRMVRGARTTLVRYRLRDTAAGTLELRPLLPCRESGALTIENDELAREVTRLEGGLRMQPYASLPPLELRTSPGARFRSDPVWYRGQRYPADEARGYEGHEDQFSPGILTLHLAEGRDVLVAFSIDPLDETLEVLWEREEEVRTERLRRARSFSTEPAWYRLAHAAEDFLYETPDGRLGIDAGFPWFGEWGRDTFVSLPGLTLARGDLAACARVLSGAVPFLQGGLLPNVFGVGTEDSHYGSVDASLWFARAVRLYERAGGETERVLDEYLPALVEIAEAYFDGTELGIRADEGCLVRSGDTTTNATWMDARASDGPVTPRHGFAVEVNALWYALLASLERLHGIRRDSTARRRWQERRRTARKAFLERFWLAGGGYLADVWKEREVDASVRPNMVIAAALEASPLTRTQRASIVERSGTELLTPRGLRTLSPRHPDYVGRYGGGPDERDRAYHQGTVWPWLLGFHVEAALRAYGTRRRTRDELKALLDGFAPELDRAGLDHVSEVFDGDAPHAPGGTIAQAWSTAELLRARKLLEEGPL